MADDAVESKESGSGAAPEYTLTHVLKAHTSDVRSVATAFDTLSAQELVFSGSRDESGTFWSREPSSSSSSSFQRGPTFRGNRYCNSIAYIPPQEPWLPRGQVLLGSLDSQIRCFDPLRSDKPQQILSEHWDNISVVRTAKGIKGKGKDEAASPPCFISGSWDKTARVWVMGETSTWQCIQTLKGHDEAVWGVSIIETPTSNAKHGKYLTSSADLFIRLFHGEQLFAVYAGHTDVVRSVQLLPTSGEGDDNADEQQTAMYPDEYLFASASNDGTIRIWSLDDRRSPNPGNGGEALRILRGHTSLVYDVACFGDTQDPAKRRQLVSSGEDGTFRVWDWVSANLLSTVQIPVISVWSIAVLPKSEDVVVGCSDSLVRVYSLQTPHLSESDSHFSGALLSVKEAKEQADQAREMESSVKASQRVSTEASPDQAAGQEREHFEGEQYDAVLRIDVSDDSEPLPFPINRDDDRLQAAKNFVEKHALPESYVDQIVDFVNLVLGKPDSAHGADSR